MATATKTRRAPSQRETYAEKMTRLRETVDRFTEQFEDADERAALIASVKGYSDRNATLIVAQDPDAADVRGYKKWIEAGRIVVHGGTVHRIEILAPSGQKDGETREDGSKERDHKFFRSAFVWDHRHTEPLSDHAHCEKCKGKPWSKL